MDAQLKFEDPVILLLDGGEREVINLADAGLLLLHEWPVKTRRRRLAMQAVRDALNGAETIATARKAFVDAAIEVWILKAA